MSSYSLRLSNRLPLRDRVLSQTDLRPDLSWLSGSGFVDRLAECIRCVCHNVSFPVDTGRADDRSLQGLKAGKSSKAAMDQAQANSMRYSMYLRSQSEK